MPFDVAALAEEVLIDSEGSPVRLGDLWADRTEVILFLRHFG